MVACRLYTRQYFVKRAVFVTTLLLRLGRASVRRRRFVLACWAAVTVAVLVLARASGGETSDALEVPGVESQRAHEVLAEQFPGAAGTNATLVFAIESGSLAEPEPAAVVAAATADVAAHPDVLRVGELQLSDDGTIGFADVQYSRPVEEITEVAFGRLEATAAVANAGGVVQMELGGDLPSRAVRPDPGGREIIGLLVAVIVLLVAFGSVIAMALPIGLALVGLAVSFGLITIIASGIVVSSAAPTIAAMIGLGVGIDYALFIVTRHRENLRLGLTVEEAAGRAIATAGSAVVFAGTTVVIAICGLAIAGITAVTVMGLMAGLTVIVMVAGSLTLLPALLGFAGTRIDAIRVPGMKVGAGTSDRESVWHRWGRHVSGQPWRYLVGGVAALLVLSTPMLSLRLGSPDEGVRSTELTTRRAYDLLADGFGVGFNGPLLLTVQLDGAGTADLGPITGAIAADPGVQAVVAPFFNPAGTAAVVRVIPTSAPQDQSTNALVHRIRDDILPVAVAATDGVEAVSVGGETALSVDLSDKISSRLSWFIGAVILLSVLLLMMVFRSIAVPIKAAFMNLLSIGAAYGVIVAVFQWGWLSGLFGVEETVPIIAFIPLMLFAILFGLSMDYEVFLLSRVREEYLKSGDNDSAVIEGIAGTARVITSAALIMISVFAAFVLGDDPMIKMFGLGLSTAVLIDATLVRIVLVPATMNLLGDWNWWFPAWLDRLLPRIDVEGHAGFPEPVLLREPDPNPVPA